MTDSTRLSLDQKAALLSGQDFAHTKPVDEAGVPALTLVDGPHGLRVQDADQDHLGVHESRPATCFPPAVAVGSSWDPDVAGSVGEAVGREARAAGVAVNLGPGVNIKRSPLCGRNFEYYSEDPLLSGVLGTAHVRALQSQGVGASVKHFAANNQETERMHVSAEVDERTLREIYLPAFERVVTQADPATVMCSYNRINGVAASQNRWLLTEVLRDEWGFEGVVISDWGAVYDKLASLLAGLDLEMPGSGGKNDVRLVEAVCSGEVPESRVDEAVQRVLTLTRHHTEPTGRFDADEHHALARRLAAECAVLLKNDRQSLPLAHDAEVAVIGEFARAPRFQGGGSSHINPTRVQSALDSLRELGTNVTYAPGFHLDGSPDESLRSEAVSAARAADVAVVFAGLPDAHESEGYDRDTLDLPADQIATIRAVADAAARTVVVLSHGGVVSLEGWHDDVDAILDGFLLGQAGGGALADLLRGEVNPSGHLAESIPLRLQDNPTYLNFPGEQGHVRYGEGVMVGYRYYETAQVPVRYPFGHGLSYTTFETVDLTVTTTGPDTATASITVTNTGSRAGKHVVQLYVATDAGPVRRPARELRAFTKVALEPGQTRTVELELDSRAFAYYDVEAGRWVTAPGDYAIQVGRSAADVVAEQRISLDGEVIRKELTLDSTVREWFGHPDVGPRFLDRIAAGMGEQQAHDPDRSTGELRMIDSLPLHQFLNFLEGFGGGVPAEEIEELIQLSKTTD
ncbi:glycoside hydrolase family 3 C-terminal domain-containing protein [Saccharopolyspora flava]|uniref:Exo-alpha-(1->6)-L-arabinopyranosidase n=1 Tax=Saccharopolyspora flava TaxID=95161 RepID=A0A1I6UEQ4_9PSEU|nr:glycoside hydrolase family 3 C-terminal domain-containing protein [Saccharopolyspora flava]SFS99959.1 beta-glucosidase [Saccharopolyspora flava]